MVVAAVPKPSPSDTAEQRAADAPPGLQRDVPLPEPDAEMPVDAPVGGERRSRFRIYTCDELERLPPVAWLIERHIPLGGFTVLYGAPGSGKSFLSLAWGLTVAAIDPDAATTWLQWQALFGPVVYIAAEGGAGIRQRIRAYRDAHALAVEPALYTITEPVNLIEATDALLEDVRGALPCWPSVFVIDTLARCLGGGDENGPEAMGGAVLAIDRIRQVSGAAVVVDHHTGRQGEMPRGHSSLDAAVDSMFFLKDEGGLRVLECKKQRDAEAVGLQRFTLVPQGTSCTIEPAEGGATGSAKMTSNCWRALRALQMHFVGMESASGPWQRVSGLATSSFYLATKALQTFGYVTKRGSKYMVTSAGEAALQGNQTAGVPFGVPSQ